MTAHHERDYIERTIATVRNHRGADNCWPQWANIFADEIEACWAEIDAVGDDSDVLADAAAVLAALDLGMQAWRTVPSARDRFTEAVAALGRLRVAALPGADGREPGPRGHPGMSARLAAAVQPAQEGPQP